MGSFNFRILDTSPGARECLFGCLPDETPQQYQERLRAMWRSDPCARQHLAVYTRYWRRGLLRFSGPMADVAEQVIKKLAAKNG